MSLGPAWERGYLESGLHEVDLAFFDVEDLVDLGHEVGEVLDEDGFAPFGFGVIGHLHAHHYYCDILITDAHAYSRRYDHLQLKWPLCSNLG